MMENTKYKMQKKIKLSCKGIILDNENDDISIILFRDKL